ncbi:MAG: ABC transporter substrate-binding protein, partial [Pseudobutyrivibrio sp.]|nr:ABC transporter substrate-binding protein [Pseudobutyrivibrio sp.]
MKKRILSLALASAMALSMVACGGNQESAAPAANDGAATT